MMITGRDIAKQAESCRLVAYPDPKTGGEPITIGWGSTRNKDGQPFKIGDKITQDMADALFTRDFNAEKAKVIADKALSNLPNECIDAIVSVCYNIKGGFVKFKTSDCYKAIVAKDIPNIYHNWDWGIFDKSVALGLARRRSLELASFLFYFKA